MLDARLKKLAGVLVNYSTVVQSGDLVMISAPPIAEPLAIEIYKAALAAGGHPQLKLVPDELTELMLKYGSDQQLKYLSPLRVHEVETIDVNIGIWAETNTRALSNTDSAKHAAMSAARKPIFSRFLERVAKNELRWTGTIFPTNASAQDAAMSLAEYEDFVFGAGLLGEPDPVEAWRSVARKQQTAVELLSGKRQLHLESANGTDLSMSIEGRKWINCCGKENFPDGEIFTSPLEDSVEGTIVFSFPAMHMHQECDGVRLRFEKGLVVEATAEKGEDFLNAMLDQDAGARRVGEFAIGCNYGISRFTRNTLFDEKIGGTVHLAVGASLPESGGSNQSALHWDMVCDLRGGGKVTVDGEIVYRDGKFVGIDL